MGPVEVGTANDELEVANKDSLREEDEKTETAGGSSSCETVEGETLRWEFGLWMTSKRIFSMINPSVTKSSSFEFLDLFEMISPGMDGIMTSRRP